MIEEKLIIYIRYSILSSHLDFYYSIFTLHLSILLTTNLLLFSTIYLCLCVRLSLPPSFLLSQSPSISLYSYLCLALSLSYSFCLIFLFLFSWLLFPCNAISLFSSHDWFLSQRPGEEILFPAQLTFPPWVIL